MAVVLEHVHRASSCLTSVRAAVPPNERPGQWIQRGCLCLWLWATLDATFFHFCSSLRRLMAATPSFAGYLRGIAGVVDDGTAHRETQDTGRRRRSGVAQS